MLPTFLIKNLFEQGYDFYLSQYEALIIKFFTTASRNVILITFISFVHFLISFFIEQNCSDEEILFDIDDWSHLNPQNIFIASNENDNYQYFYSQPSSSTKFIILSNITNLIQLEQFFSSKISQTSYPNSIIPHQLNFHSTQTFSTDSRCLE